MDYEWSKMELIGTRYYHRFALSSILPGRSHLFRNSTSLLKAIDKLFNSVVDAFNRRSDAPQLKFELIQQLSLEDDEFIGQFLDHQIFARSVREFNWIQSFPWVTEDTHFEKEQAKYPFSLIARQFQSFFCKFLNDKHELQALAMVHIHNGFLCMPYVFVPESQAKNLEAFIKSFVKQNKISVTTLSSSKTEKDIHLGPVSKSYDRNFFFGPELSVPQNAKINYGDGDAVFV